MCVRRFYADILRLAGLFAHPCARPAPAAQRRDSGPPSGSRSRTPIDPLLLPCSNLRSNPAMPLTLTLKALLSWRDSAETLRRLSPLQAGCFDFDQPSLLTISVCFSSSASQSRASIGLSSFTRGLHNELSRHKTDVDPFVPLRISNVNIQFLAAAAAPQPNGDMLRGVWTHRLDDRFIPRLIA
jgi:hypothetical protein